MEDLAACSGLRIFVGCWLGHDGSKSHGIWRLARTSGFWLAAGCATNFFGQWRIKKLVVAREILMAVGFLEIVVANRISVL